jgi:CRP-like cAMP-binding protein
VVLGSILENLTLSSREQLSDVTNERELDRVLGVARKWGLDRAWSITTAHDLGRTVGHHRYPVSDELRARLGFARAELGDPDVVIIDDPTLRLPDTIATDLWSTAREAFHDRCILATTERLDVISPEDSVVTIRYGLSAEAGTREQLLAAGGGFARLWSQFVTGGPDLARLSAVPLLADLDEATLSTLSNRLMTEHFETGSIIYADDDRADRLFVVVDGEVAISHDRHDIATVGRGQHFGDLSTDDPEEIRRHEARALVPTVLHSLHRNSISAGVAGVLDLPAAHRQVFAQLARSGEQLLDELVGATAHTADVVTDVIADLVSKGLVRRGVGELGITYRLAAAQSRRVSGTATARLLDDVQQSTR